MSYQFYNSLHIISVILLVGFTFYAFAGPSAASKKWVLGIGGLASLAALATGLIMVMKLGAFPGWVWIKLFSWLAISAFAGVAYRRRGLSGVLMLITVALVALAAWAVTYKPF